jgi:hypothetical protein
MNQLSLINSYEKTKEAFSFLISDYQFSLIKDERLNDGFTLEYQLHERMVHLYYDYRDNRFSFYIIKGSKTIVPNDNDHENVKSLYDLFKKNEPILNFKSFQPNDAEYETALYKNASFLKKYGSSVLKGIDWI